MRKISTLAAVAVAATIGGFQHAQAGLLGMPMGLHAAIQHIKFETTTLAPEACEDDCRPGMMFRGSPLRLTAEGWDDLQQVNETHNPDIAPERSEFGLTARNG